MTGRDEGIVAFVCGIASARSTGGWNRGRVVASVAILTATLAWYIVVVAGYADF